MQSGAVGGGSDAQQGPVQRHAASAAIPEPAQPGGSSTPGAESSGGFAFEAGSFGFDSHSQAAVPGASSDPVSFADLDAALSAIGGAAGTAQATAATQPRKTAAGSSTASTGFGASPPLQPPGALPLADAVWLQQTGPTLPEFYLSWRDEPEAAPDELRPADAAHITSLVDQYKANHEMVRIISACIVGSLSFEACKQTCCV